jgi:hypothetical protein
MTDQFSPRLSEYLDDELTHGDRLVVERHLLDCANSRAELDELRRIVADARALPDTPPSHDLWPDVRAALPLPSRRRSITVSIPQAIAAGVLLAIVSGLCVWLFLDPQRHATPAIAMTPSGAATIPASATSPSMVSYDRAVDDLKKLLNEERSRLSPKTIEALERNLATIDNAIAEASTALAQDPSDPFLNSHLAQQRRAKLALLRQATQRARAGL